MKREHISDVRNKMHCEECKLMTGFIAQTEVTDTSQYLVVCLQRYTAVSQEKDPRNVKVERHLRVLSQGYDLYAVVRHKGSKTGGHYTSVVQISGNWYLCNDSKVRKLEEEEVVTALQQDAYVLFYRRNEGNRV